MSSSNGGLYKILSRVYAPAIFSLTHSTSSSRENHYRANMSKPKFTPLRLGDSLTSNWGLHVTHNTFLHSLLSYPRDDGDSSRFLKQFETLKLLGMGGFGFVCEVMSFSDLNKYAIKVIPLYLEDEVQEEV